MGKEQGMRRFWDGNFTNCIRYFPTQAFNLSFKDTFKKMFPKYDAKADFAKFFGANLVSGGLAAAGSMCIVYPLDYSRTRLASDVGSGKKTFSGLLDCMQKTGAGPWFRSIRRRYRRLPRTAVGLFRHHHRFEPLEERQRCVGYFEYIHRRTNRNHHRSRCNLSF